MLYLHDILHDTHMYNHFVISVAVYDYFAWFCFMPAW